jgi:hypothetical protein
VPHVFVRVFSRRRKTKENSQLRHACLLALLAAFAAALVPQGTAKQGRSSRVSRLDTARVTRVLASHIEIHRAEATRWQRLMHGKRTLPVGSARPIRSVAYGRWVLRLWHRRALAARRRALNPPHRSEWLCIQRHEAAWTDPDAPYYGGLQMDREFQATFGAELLRSKGTAEHWTPLEQMWVAERAYRARGFWPWPNTARYCGVL